MLMSIAEKKLMCYVTEYSLIYYLINMKFNIKCSYIKQKYDLIIFLWSNKKKN